MIDSKIRNLFAAVLLSLLPIVLSANQPRKFHYIPWHDIGAVCIDGDRLFNRALYGAHSGFRLECSDMPEFGIYLPRMGGNMKITLPEGRCKAVYVPGKMIYDQGGVLLTANVLRSADAAIWRLTNNNDHDAQVRVRFGGVADKKFSREGDLGVDPPDCFSLKPEYCDNNLFTVNSDTIWVEFGVKERKTLTLLIPFDQESIEIDSSPCIDGVVTLLPGETKYIALFPTESKLLENHRVDALAYEAEVQRDSLASSVTIFTPDEWINPIGASLAIAADGIWSGQAWLHGAVGWRTPHLGWRGAYTGDALGLHDKSHVHFANYAKNQITDRPAIYPHPTQDSALNLARAEKKWGTPMYSNGYICRRPGHTDEMSHYDMNLVYIDALLRHFRHTGDVDEMREFFPVIQRHLDWEKRNFDSDNDGLYDAYCCIWASDALYYTGGDVTHSSSYNYFANNLAGQVCEALGYDPSPYYEEAEKIKNAIDNNLWLPDSGHWAEFRDRLGHRRLHPSAAVWTIYHAIDSEISDPFKAFAATTYIDRCIPHIPIEICDDMIDDSLYMISTTNWKPYSWSINNVAIAEQMHTALAYWQADRPDDAFKLMKSVAIDNMYLGASPLNFGQISYYDAARGECYRDFADPIGVWSRAIVEGLYGIRPNLLNKYNKHVEIRPGFPAQWHSALIDLPDIGYEYISTTVDSTYVSDKYIIKSRFGADVDIVLNVRLRGVPESIKVNDKDVILKFDESSINTPRAIINADGNNLSIVEIKYNRTFAAEPTGQVRREGKVEFVQYADGDITWWKTSMMNVDEGLRFDIALNSFDDVNPDKCFTVDMANAYNANVTDIFKNEYLSPRPDVTTLQIPVQGIGDWCHPKTSADIDDAGLRSLLKESDGLITLPNGISFKMAAEGNNVMYTSLWDNYPDKSIINVSTNASHAYLVLAGSTNHMESDVVNGIVRFVYSDGSADTLNLVNPYNWTPIEQDLFYDEYAFSLPSGYVPPLRMHLATGHTSRHLGDDLGITGVDGRRIDGGAAIILDARLNPNKLLKQIEVETVSCNIVMGVMAITLQRP